LVAAVRAGDDGAFEQLYHRYQRRIGAYIYGMVHDHGRAEDITQDVFMSALRRMRATDTPIAFKPWVYEIAKNACIDAFRRSRRAEEVSYDADEGTERLHLVSNGPTPDAAVDTRMSLDHLRGAFGGLSEAHHQILVMRELEGLSYRQIGEKLGMSRPSVESTLFRARRRLSEEYEELISGERCRRIQAIIADATDGRVGVRDERKMARHVSYCQPCRRAAFAAGFDPATLQPKRTVREKIAGLLPLPGFAKRWIAGGGDGGSLLSSAAHYAEGSSGAWMKAAAAAAAIVVAGIGADKVRPQGNGSHSTAPPAVAPAPAAHTTTTSAPSTSTTSGGSGTVAHHGQSTQHGSSSSAGNGAASGSGSSTSSQSHGSGSGSAPSSSTGKGGSSGSGSDDDPVKKAARSVTDKLPNTSGTTGTSTPSVPDVKVPVVQVPNAQVPNVQVPNVQVPTVPGAPPAVNGAIGTVNGAASGATGTVNGAVSGATGTVNGAVSGATGAVNGAVSGATGAVNNTASGATGTVNNVTGGILGGG
jgi:RNA polymerase sigma factor (sigma-70 family)